MASKNLTKQEASLQAIILADNFDICAAPLDISWALIPFAGARLIDYTIEFFLQTEVDELIIFSVIQAQEVEKYVRERWISPGLLPFRVIFMSSQNCRGIGDAMRDIDSKALIKTDFFLTQAGFVSNDDLSTAVAAHRSRRTKDNNAVLTLVYAEVSVNHPGRYRNSDSFLVLDTITNRLLHYQRFGNNRRQFDFPLEVLIQNDEITSRFDLLDCNMAICSARIPPLFADNFDFQTRHHLIREILTNEEILSYRMYVHTVQEKYAAFIGDLNTYIIFNQNILERSCFPIAPDALNGEDKSRSRYWCRWPNIYLSKSVRHIAKSARLERSVLIGSNCEIAENCQLFNVVMGGNCKIGPNCVLRNCILWNDVVVEPNCFVQNSIVCDKGHLGANTRVKERCVIGAQVSIPSNVTIPPGTIICKKKPSQEWDIIAEIADFSPSNFLWRIGRTSSNEEIIKEIWPSYIHLDIADQAEGVVSDESSDEKSGDELRNTTKHTANVEEASGSLLAEDDYETFYQEVLESLKRGYAKQISCENLVMEINSSKHAYNVPVTELQRRVMTAILSTALEQNKIKTDSAADLIKAYKSVLFQFLPLINNYFKPKNHSSITFSSAQTNCLESIKHFALTKQRILPALSQILYFLYDKDIFEEEILLPWCNEIPEPLKTQLQSFIQWLEEAEEESSDDD